MRAGSGLSWASVGGGEKAAVLLARRLSMEKEGMEELIVGGHNFPHRPP